MTAEAPFALAGRWTVMTGLADSNVPSPVGAWSGQRSTRSGAGGLSVINFSRVGVTACAQASAPAGLGWSKSHIKSVLMVPSLRRKTWFTSSQKTCLPSASFLVSSPARRQVSIHCFEELKAGGLTPFSPSPPRGKIRRTRILVVGCRSLTRSTIALVPAKISSAV